MQPKPEWYSDDFTAKYMYGHSRSKKLGEKFRIGDEENHDIPWKMYLFMLKKNYSKHSLYVLKKLLDC